MYGGTAGITLALQQKIVPFFDTETTTLVYDIGIDVTSHIVPTSRLSRARERVYYSAYGISMSLHGAVEHGTSFHAPSHGVHVTLGLSLIHI